MSSPKKTFSFFLFFLNSHSIWITLRFRKKTNEGLPINVDRPQLFHGRGSMLPFIISSLIIPLLDMQWVLYHSPLWCLGDYIIFGPCVIMPTTYPVRQQIKMCQHPKRWCCLRKLKAQIPYWRQWCIARGYGQFVFFLSIWLFHYQHIHPWAKTK